MSSTHLTSPGPGGFEQIGGPPPADPGAFLCTDSGDEAAAPARTLVEQAYLRLRQHIIEGRYPPGTKLRVEHLKNVYQVGAGTLREALTRLVSDALVIAEGQRGFRVKPMSLADLADITRLRIHIEIHAMRESVRQGDQAWEQRVRRAYEELSAYEQPVSLAQRSAWEACNRRFHEELVSAAASPWTILVLRILWQHGERYRRLCIGLEEGRPDVHREHAEIYEAAMRRADARAALALENHIGTTLTTLQRLPAGSSPLN
ncbi:MAG: GntR family transcriptional regulator [Thiomonas sp.]|uniref:GntR family transcriptional regulator n=1 Tax=Thiomonas sp. TaxID=2047785 RepID=UPI002A368919|nr:GntR family transcriptional regulator [Thiomonas sp.]MDY0329164.1 GntR family transcriptional regulator [Thiomonas sp.]